MDFTTVKHSLPSTDTATPIPPQPELKWWKGVCQYRLLRDYQFECDVGERRNHDASSWCSSYLN
jgi:hypothetical protein